jgi:hypothetical protein
MALIHRRLGHVAERSGSRVRAIEHLRMSLAFYDDLIGGGMGAGGGDERDRSATRAELAALRQGQPISR